MKKALKNKKGFTLVELIIVIVIIAVLAGIAIPIVSGFVNRAHDSATLAEANAARLAVIVAIADPDVDEPADAELTEWNNIVSALVASEGSITALTTSSDYGLETLVFTHTDRGNVATWRRVAAAPNPAGWVVTRP